MNEWSGSVTNEEKIKGEVSSQSGDRHSWKTCSFSGYPKSSSLLASRQARTLAFGQAYIPFFSSGIRPFLTCFLMAQRLVFGSEYLALSPPYCSPQNHVHFRSKRMRRSEIVNTKELLTWKSNKGIHHALVGNPHGHARLFKHHFLIRKIGWKPE